MAFFTQRGTRRRGGRALREGIRAVLAWDPAARSPPEVLLCYPGMHALWAHRVNHFLWNHGLKLVVRILAHIVRRRTGVEIHLGVTIGRRVVIDHGMGIVIGETAVIGSDVRMYSGVLIGTTSRLPGKRHPTIEDDVLIGANALLLGPIRIGRGARIAAGGGSAPRRRRGCGDQTGSGEAVSPAARARLSCRGRKKLEIAHVMLWRPAVNLA